MAMSVKDKEETKLVFILQVMADLEPLSVLSRQFRHSIYSVFPALIAVSWLIGYGLARRFLRPIHLITRTARRISSTNLNERLLRTNSGDELDMLAATLNDMIERLEDSFALLRQFAADAAHELRTPLTLLKGEAELALRADPQDLAAHRAALESIIAECDHMITVVTNLLSLYRADAGDEAMAHGPVRLDLLLTEMAETFRILAEEAQLTLDTQPFPPVAVLGHRSRLHELFANILDNAVKYTPAGGRVTLSAELDADDVHVTIADTGVGIPEEELPKVFTRFYRVDHSRSRDTGGSGLGLTIAKSIAIAHGGTIEADSAPGAGSSFTVTLPLAPPSEGGGAGPEDHHE
jgi:heavy metal sensor kinase